MSRSCYSEYSYAYNSLVKFVQVETVECFFVGGEESTSIWNTQNAEQHYHMRNMLWTLMKKTTQNSHEEVKKK